MIRRIRTIALLALLGALASGARAHSLTITQVLASFDREQAVYQLLLAEGKIDL